MKRLSLACILGAGLFLQSFALPVDRVITFGDSLSDNGNVDALTRRLHKVMPIIPVVPKPDVYFHGHFTNGEVWNEVMAQGIGMDPIDGNELEDHAFGGAWAESVLKSRMIFPPSLGSQVTAYLVENYFDKHKGDHLYTVWVGGNDYLIDRKDADEATASTIASIKYQIDRLVYYGARYFVVPNLPDLGQTPKARQMNEQAEFTALTELHNKRLDVALNELMTQYPDITIIAPDVNGALSQVRKEGKNNAYGITNMVDPCYTGNYFLNNVSKSPALMAQMKAAADAGLDIEHNISLQVAMDNDEPYTICDHPESYIFWDLVHPTSKVHWLIGEEVAKVLREKGLVKH